MWLRGCYRHAGLVLGHSVLWTKCQALIVAIGVRYRLPACGWNRAYIVSDVGKGVARGYRDGIPVQPPCLRRVCQVATTAKV